MNTIVLVIVATPMNTKFETSSLLSEDIKGGKSIARGCTPVAFHFFLTPSLSSAYPYSHAYFICVDLSIFLSSLHDHVYYAIFDIFSS